MHLSNWLSKRICSASPSLCSPVSPCFTPPPSLSPTSWKKCPKLTSLLMLSFSNSWYQSVVHKTENLYFKMAVHVMSHLLLWLSRPFFVNKSKIILKDYFNHCYHIFFWPMWHGLWESVPLAFSSTSTQVSYDFQLAFFYLFQSRVMWIIFKLSHDEWRSV